MEEGLRRFIDLYNRGEFFHAHEVLEAVWALEKGQRRLFLQSLIHIAAAFHHYGRGNARGAAGQFRKALTKLAAFRPVCESIDTGRLFEDIRGALVRMESDEPVSPCCIVVLTNCQS